MEDIRELVKEKNEELKAESADAVVIEFNEEAEAKIKQAWETDKVTDDETFMAWIEDPAKLWEVLGAKKWFAPFNYNFDPIFELEKIKNSFIFRFKIYIYLLKCTITLLS